MSKYIQDVMDRFTGKEGATQDDVMDEIKAKGLDLFDTVSYLSSLAYCAEMEDENPAPEIKPLIIHDDGPEPEDEE